MALGNCARLCSKYPYCTCGSMWTDYNLKLKLPALQRAIDKRVAKVSIGTQARELTHANRSYSDDADSWNRDTDFDRANL